MKRVLTGLMVVLALASCGADGMPSKPEPRDVSNEPTGPVDMMEATG